MAKFIVEGDVEEFKRKVRKYNLGCKFVEMVKEKTAKVEPAKKTIIEKVLGKKKDGK